MIAESAIGRLLSPVFRDGCGFDWLYDWVFVKPYLLVAQLNRHDAIAKIFGLIQPLAKMGNSAMSATETGRVRWYATSMALGAVLVLGAALYLQISFNQ